MDEALRKAGFISRSRLSPKEQDKWGSCSCACTFSAQTTQSPYIKPAGFTAKARAGFLLPEIRFTSLIFSCVTRPASCWSRCQNGLILLQGSNDEFSGTLQVTARLMRTLCRTWWNAMCFYLDGNYTGCLWHCSWYWFDPGHEVRCRYWHRC